jgi:hypothetical protein
MISKLFGGLGDEEGERGYEQNALSPPAPLSLVLGLVFTLVDLGV